MAEITDKKQGKSNVEEAGKSAMTTKPTPDGGVTGQPEAASRVTRLLEGFTPKEIAALVRTKEAVAKGRYSDVTNEHKKLLFAKWLVEHGRLTG